MNRLGEKRTKNGKNWPNQTEKTHSLSGMRLTT